jgi:serine protease AprX
VNIVAIKAFEEAEHGSCLNVLRALMLENDPSLTPDEIKCRMRDSATSIAEKGAGAGYVDAVAAVNSKASSCANIGMNVAMELAGMGHYRGPLSGAIDGSLNADAVALSEGRDFQMVGNHWTSGNYWSNGKY